MKRILLLATMMSLNALVAVAGPGDGGGGGAIVCRKQNGRIKSVEMLDTHEGRVRYGLTFSTEKKSEQEWINFALKKLDQDQKVILSSLVNEVKSRLSRLPEGTTIKFPSDAEISGRPVFSQSGCDLEAVGFYDDTFLAGEGKLMVSPELFDKMSEFSRAAFYLHEAIYLQHRRLVREAKISSDEAVQDEQTVLQNIEAVRRAVASLLAENVHSSTDEYKWLLVTPKYRTPGFDLNYLIKSAARDYYFSLKLEFEIQNSFRRGDGTTFTIQELNERILNLKGRILSGEKYDLVWDANWVVTDLSRGVVDSNPIRIVGNRASSLMKWQFAGQTYDYKIRTQKSYRILDKKTGEVVVNCFAYFQHTNPIEVDERQCSRIEIDEMILRLPGLRDEVLHQAIQNVEEDMAIVESQAFRGQPKSAVTLSEVDFTGSVVYQTKRLNVQSLSDFSITLHRNYNEAH